MKQKLDDINLLVVHGSFTKSDFKGSGPEGIADDIEQWHLDRGWRHIGYHIVIERGGEAKQTLEFDQRGIHTVGHNKNSISVCLAGGASEHADLSAPPESQIWSFNYDDDQLNTLGGIFTNFIEQKPVGIIKGHGELQDRRSCPGFSPWLWYRTEYMKNAG